MKDTPVLGESQPINNTGLTAVWTVGLFPPDKSIRFLAILTVAAIVTDRK
jgi:hypothetical protein